MNVFALLLIFCSIVIPLPGVGLAAAQIHLIMVGDTASTDIGATVTPDLEHMHQQTSAIAKLLHVHLEERTFIGSQVNSRQFFNALSSLKVDHDDLIIFYFSGHGYRTKSKDAHDPWPNLVFSLEHAGVDFLDVVDIIKEKNPRLVIALADSCNNYLAPGHIPVVKPAKKPLMRSLKLPKVNARFLFMEPAGEILISAASPGEVSWGTLKGGLFTNAFLFSLSQAIDRPQLPDWAQILSEASDSVLENQTPQNYINISY